VATANLDDLGLRQLDAGSDIHKVGSLVHYPPVGTSAFRKVHGTESAVVVAWNYLL
jgi:hypothetical protein